MTRYDKIDFDLDKPKPEYTWAERRSFLYHIILENGYLTKPQRVYAEVFDIGQAQISKDITKINEFVAEHRDSKEVEQQVHTIVEKCIENLYKENEYYDVIKSVDKRIDMMQKIGKMDRQPDKHEIEGSGEFSINIIERKKQESDD